MPYRSIKKVLFDTSFLLNVSSKVDNAIKLLHRDRVQCYISSTVDTELDNLYYVGRINQQQYGRARSRCRRVETIELGRNHLQSVLARTCAISMNNEQGTKRGEVQNDCNILTSSLQNDIDMILSEDFHFTSRYTDRVVDTVCDTACDRFHRLCECDILLLNKDTFLSAYSNSQIDLDIVETMKLSVREQ